MGVCLGHRGVSTGAFGVTPFQLTVNLFHSKPYRSASARVAKGVHSGMTVIEDDLEPKRPKEIPSVLSLP